MLNDADVQPLDLTIKTRNHTERILTENNEKYNNKTPDDVKRPPAYVLGQRPLKRRKTLSRTSHPMDTPKNTSLRCTMPVNRRLLTILDEKEEVEDTENDTAHVRKRKMGYIRNEMDVKLACRKNLAEQRMREEEDHHRILAEKKKKEDEEHLAFMEEKNRQLKLLEEKENEEYV